MLFKMYLHCDICYGITVGTKRRCCIYCTRCRRKHIFTNFI